NNYNTNNYNKIAGTIMMVLRNGVRSEPVHFVLHKSVKWERRLFCEPLGECFECLLILKSQRHSNLLLTRFLTNNRFRSDEALQLALPISFPPVANCRRFLFFGNSLLFLRLRFS